MATKSQHNKNYKALPTLLKGFREDAGLSQRDIGQLLSKPQSYVYNCEVGNRRVDITEFVLWAEACNIKPQIAFKRLLKEMGR